MTTRLRLSMRTGIVGAWTLMIGFVGVLVAERLVTLVDDAASTPLVTAGVPMAGALTAVLTSLYDGGSVSVFLGLMLVFVGWYQVLTTT